MSNYKPLTFNVKINTENIEDLIHRIHNLQTYKLFENDDMLLVNLEEVCDIFTDSLVYEKLNQKDAPSWIPVTERLPEEGVSVQVCFHSQGGIAQAVSERFVNDRNQSYWSGLCGAKPTHWMPLQEPPKEET